ncbi:MAG: hypothetical protein WAV28_04335, partial [Sedimentisphaerales bacterium]
TITMTCDSLLVRHGKRYVLNRPLSVAYATALMLSAKIYYDWYHMLSLAQTKSAALQNKKQDGRNKSLHKSLRPSRPSDPSQEKTCCRLKLLPPPHMPFFSTLGTF